MEITCGSFLIDPLNRILMCLTTGTKNFWTVPKGLPESHESFYEAAVRELEEETGIDITKYSCDVSSLGAQPYTVKKKMIIGFVFILKDVITQDLFCDSYFTDRKTKLPVKEICDYRWMDVQDAISIMRPEQRKLIKDYIDV